MQTKKQIIVAIDPGSENSGIVILEETKLMKGLNLTNEEMFSLIDQYSLFDDNVNLTVAYEDIRPYTSRFNMQTIDTCKIIGRLEYVLKQQRIPCFAITRNDVKYHLFKTYPELIIPEIEKKITKKGKVSKKGVPLKPSFHYVDDRIVLKCMKFEWNIEKPKVGKTNIYGIKEHSWQALGVASVYLSRIAAL